MRGDVPEGVGLNEGLLVSYNKRGADGGKNANLI